MTRLKLILITALANTFEWYDYTLFGNFADIIGSKFFSIQESKSAILKAFLVFAAGYITRPLGGAFFGIIGDKIGRKAALSTAVILMGLPTVAISLLPSYEYWGIFSTIILVFLRMLQGLSMGGVLTSSICFSIEHSDKKHQNFISSVSMASICAGILLGSVVAFTTRSILTPESFEDWGWRIPFFLGAIVIFIGLYIKWHMSETPEFNKETFGGKEFLAPLVQAVKLHWKKMLISIGINSTGSILFYLQAVYLANFLKLNSNFSIIVIDKISSISYACMIFFTLFAGWLADKFGNARILTINLIALILSIIPLLAGAYSDNIYNIMFVQIIFGFLAATYISLEISMQANFYPAAIRSTALALSYNISTTIFGGATPYILENITQTTDSLVSCAYYVIFFAFISLYSIVLYNRILNSSSEAIDHNKHTKAGKTN